MNEITDPERIFAALDEHEVDYDAGDIDVLHDAPGAVEFRELRARALEVKLGDLRVPFAGREDLIRMKRAAGRPVDLSDIAALSPPGATR